MQETPEKVVALLGTALASLFMLFVVTSTNASFQGQELSFPDPFAPAKVVSMLDNAAHGYSQFVAVQLVRPGAQSYALAADNIRWVIDNSDEAILTYTGLKPLAAVDAFQTVPKPQVAGAFTSRQPAPPTSLIDSLYSFLIK